MNEIVAGFETDASLLQRAFEQSLDGIIVVREGRIDRANRAFCDLHALPLNRVIGRAPLDFVHPDDREPAGRLLADLLQGTRSSCLQTYRLPSEGEDQERHVEATYRAFLWRRERVLLAIVRDVSPSGQMAGRLRQSESRYRTLFDSVPIGLYRTTPDGRVVDVNPALVRMLQYPSRDALLGIQVDEGYAAAEARRAWQARIDAEGVIQGSEAQWRTSDGRSLWIEEHARAVKDDSGKTVFYEGSALDISRRKAVEAALEREKAYFEQLFEGAPEAVVLCNNEGRVQRANAEFHRLFGYEQDDVVDRHIDELVSPEGCLAAAEAQSITSEVTAGKRIQRESQRCRKDGALVDVSVLAQPIFLHGEQVGMYSIYRDIGRRIEAERALRTEKARFEQLYAASPEAIVLCANDGTIHRINQEFTSLFGFSEADAVGQSIDRLIAPPDRRFVEEASKLTRQIASGETGSLETVRHRKDGSAVEVSILGKPIRVDGEQIAVYGIYRDIGDRKAAERALREAHQKVARLHDAAFDLEGTQTLAKVYSQTIDAAERILGYSRCALDIVTDGSLMTVSASDATPPSRFRKAPIREAGFAGHAVETGRSSIEDEPAESRLAEAGDEPIRALVTIPLRSQDEIIGVFQAACDRPGAFADQDRQLLEILLNHTSAAIVRIRLESELKEQATHDPLTGVFNRRYFNEVIEKETLRALRYAHPIGLLMIDVNRFKQINDQQGHHVGDDVLQTIASVLQETVRETDLVVRFGGDEFLIVLTETGEDADAVADRIRTRVARNHRLQAIAGMIVTVSVGTIAWNPDAGPPIAQALAEADQRMYEEKRKG